jgi:hypothetical protein
MVLTSMVVTIRILIVFCCIYSADSQDIGQCTTLTALSAQLGLGITCLGVVDYSYFLPTGLESFLNEEANKLLSDDRLSILPPKCQVSLKKAVCSQVYLKCPPKFDQTNTTTYNYKIFSDIGVPFIPLPFQRPCLNICQNANKDCLGLLVLFSKNLNCAERKDYSNGQFGKAIGNTSYSAPFPFTFDQSPSSTVCNAMPAGKFFVCYTYLYVYINKMCEKDE